MSHKTDLYSIVLKHSWACLVEGHSEGKIALRKIKGGGLSLFEPLCHSEESGEKYLWVPKRPCSPRPWLLQKLYSEVLALWTTSHLCKTLNSAPLYTLYRNELTGCRTMPPFHIDSFFIKKQIGCWSRVLLARFRLLSMEACGHQSSSEIPKYPPLPLEHRFMRRIWRSQLIWSMACYSRDPTLCTTLGLNKNYV